jgi:Protein of unknown function (DUF2905)
MAGLGKLLLVVGGIIILMGLVLLAGGRMNLPIGRLPGDIVICGKNSAFYFPLTTSILLSVIVSLVLWLFSRGR